MATESGVDNNLDAVFTEIGEFGTFQIVSIFLICIPSLLSASYIVNFIFAANTLDYRCKINECEVSNGSNRELTYDQPWLKYAIPISDQKIENCVRFAPNDTFVSSDEDECSSDIFDRTQRIQCTEFVYKTDETNVQTEVTELMDKVQMKDTHVVAPK